MKKVVGTMLLGMLSLGAGAQNASTYGFQAVAGNFTPITGTALPSIEDDDANNGALIPIGFSFNFCGTNYTSLSPCSNGWVSFTNTIANNWTNTEAIANGFAPAVMPLFDDLDGEPGWGATAAYSVSGTFPFRVFTIQWLNYGWDFQADAAVISLQCKLYETSNIIEYVYRQEANPINGGGSATIGIIRTAGDYLVLDNSSSSPTPSSSVFTTTIAGKPADGQTYRFTPPQCAGAPSVAAASTTTPSFPDCNGGTPLLSASGFSTGNGIAYKWQGSLAGQNAWADLSYTATPGSTYNAPAINMSMDYRLITYCIATGDSSISNTVTVSVPPQPTASFQVVADSVCSNTSANIVVVGTPFAAINIDSAGVPVSPAVILNGVGIGIHNTGNLAVGSYTYTLVSATSTCTVPITGTTTVVSTPRPTGTLTSLNPSPICNGATAFISVAPITSYTWPATIYYNNGFTQGSDTATGSLDNIAITPPPGSYTYSIDYIIDAQGCQSLPGQTPGTANLTVNPTPTATISSAAPTVCNGTTVTYTVALTGTGPWTFTYTDGINDSTVVDNVNDTFTFDVTIGADTTFWISALSDSSGCPVGLPADYNTPYTVTVGAPASITGDPANFGPVCTGSSAMFMASASGFNVNYQWLQNNAIITNGGVYGGATSTMLTISDVSNLNGSTYALVATGQCGIPDTTTFATLTVNTGNTWNGSVSNAWSDPANWSCGAIPVITTDVLIPNVANDPVVDIAGAVGNSLTIQSLAMVSFGGPGTALELDSNITILTNAIFDPSNGELILSGNNPQNIPPAIYNHLTIEGGGVKNLDNDATVMGVLTLDSGVIALGANDLTLDMPESVAGGNEMSYVRTNGLGVLIGMNMDALDSVTFQVGNATYNPLGFSNNGTNDNFRVRVLDAVYVDGDGSTSTNTVGFPVVNRTWLIDEDVLGGSDVIMSPYWTPAHQINGFDIGWVYGAHHDGTMWEAMIDSTTTGSPATFAFNAYSYTTLDSVTDFSPYTVASGTQYPLSVKLSDISAVNVGARNKINWTSSSEVAGARYELQSSADGRNFAAMTTVNAKGEASSYTYFDNNAVTGINYYRIKLIDADGKSAYSKVVSATVGASSAFAVEAYPNPVSSVVTVKINGTMAENAAVEITDVTGKVIKSVKLNSNMAEINVSDVAAGVYFVKYTDEAHQESIKINKQ